MYDIYWNIDRGCLCTYYLRVNGCLYSGWWVAMMRSDALGSGMHKDCQTLREPFWRHPFKGSNDQLSPTHHSVPRLLSSTTDYEHIKEGFSPVFSLLCSETCISKPCPTIRPVILFALHSKSEETSIITPPLQQFKTRSDSADHSPSLRPTHFTD